MSSIGLFSVDGLTAQNPEFFIGSPLFDKVTIRLNNKYYSGKEFIITAKNNSKKNIYVNPVKVLDGKKNTAGSIRFADVVAGGTLDLTMQSKPVIKKK